MRRRDFIASLCVGAVWPALLHAQEVKSVRRIGVLMTYAADDPEATARSGVLERRLGELGWMRGSNLEIDYQWAGSADQNTLRARGAKILAAKPDVIICQSTPALVSVRKETQTTPLVFVQVTDPVGAGFVQNLAHPGGHITGFTDFEYDIGGKWVELLKTIDPHITVVTAVLMAGHQGNAGIVKVMEKAAQSFGLRITKAELSTRSSVERDVQIPETNGGLIVLPSPVVILHRDAIISLALSRRTPAVYPLHYFADAGGLVSYGIDQLDQWSGAASYIDRILRGDSPERLPVQQPSRFELVVNLKTAKKTGITIPQSVLARADEVID